MNLSEKTSYLKGLLDGMDKNDPLCFGVLNKIRLAQWQFEYAMAAIAHWFEDDLEDLLEH